MIAWMGNRLRPARRAGPTTDTRRQTHSGVGVGSSPLAGAHRCDRMGSQLGATALLGDRLDHRQVAAAPLRRAFMQRV
jgi:hypothetical protein